MILHSSLQIVTDGGVVTTASLQLLPMKLHVTSEGLRQPQKGCFQISVLFYDEVPRAFLHFVPFLLFMYLTAPCPISTARTRFAFQQHPCPASIFEQIYPKLYSTSMQFPSEIFRNQRPWPHIIGFLPHPPCVKWLVFEAGRLPWDTQVLHGEQRGSATSHCTDLTPGQCSALLAVSRRLGLVLCAFACTRRFWKAAVLILVRCSLPPTEGDELHPFRCPTKPVQAESVGFLVRGAALCPEPFTSAVSTGGGNWLPQDSRGRPRSAAAFSVPFTPPGGHSAHLLGQPGGLAQARSAARVPSAPSPHSPPGRHS